MIVFGFRIKLSYIFATVIKEECSLIKPETFELLKDLNAIICSAHQHHLVSNKSTLISIVLFTNISLHLIFPQIYKKKLQIVTKNALTLLKNLVKELQTKKASTKLFRANFHSQ